MTYEERKQQVCNECGSAICGYRSRGLMDKCGYLQVVMQGWELGQKDTINKACEWLKENIDNYAYYDHINEEVHITAKMRSKMYNDLKKTMKQL